MKSFLTFSLCMVAFAVSAEQPANALLGHWTGMSANAKDTSFEFRADGSATWNLQQPFEIRYRLEGTSSRLALDLFGFQSGPLKDRTLHCLVEMKGEDSFGIDCEPGERPAQLDPQQTQEFSRAPPMRQHSG